MKKRNNDSFSFLEWIVICILLSPALYLGYVCIPSDVLMWVLCSVLGGLTIAFAPMLTGAVIKILQNYARKYPSLTDVVAVITVIIVGAILIFESAVFAIVYHHMMVGSP